jgi:hypothetical protein
LRWRVWREAAKLLKGEVWITHNPFSLVIQRRHRVNTHSARSDASTERPRPFSRQGHVIDEPQSLDQPYLIIWRYLRPRSSSSVYRASRDHVLASGDHASIAHLPPTRGVEGRRAPHRKYRACGARSRRRAHAMRPRAHRSASSGSRQRARYGARISDHSQWA